MDLQPSAPYASASSFPSPVHFQIGSDPLLTFEKLHDFCEGGSSPSTNGHAKFQFPGFGTTPKSGFGIDLSSEIFPSSISATWSAAAVHDRMRSSGGTYFSPNKIAYRSAGGTDSPPLHSPPTSSSSTLQGILQRCGIGGVTAPAEQTEKRLVDMSSSRITQKIRNLDEILRSFDHYSMSKQFAIAAKDIAEPLVKTHRWPEPDVPIFQDRSSELPTSRADHSCENLGASMIPDCIAHINKSISRMEFKAQMEKLTGIIEDRWPGSRRPDKIDRVETNQVTNTLFITEPPKERKELPQVKVESPRPPGATNKMNFTPTNPNFLEEMLRNVTGAERGLAKRDRSKQSKHKGFLARGRLWVQRPASKKMAAILQKQLRRHAACINQRLDKTDLAIKSLRRQRRKVFSPFFIEDDRQEQHEKKLTLVSHSSSNAQNDSIRTSRALSSNSSEKNTGEAGEAKLVEKCMEACEALSRNTQQIQEQLHALQSDSQQLGVSTAQSSP